VAEPTAIGACSGNVGSASSATTLTPADNQPNGMKSMRFCGGVAFKGTVTFNPGLYIIDGGAMTANGNVTLTGSGVTFYFINGGRLQLGSNAVQTLISAFSSSEAAPAPA
jgi:hypothetical protein